MRSALGRVAFSALRFAAEDTQGSVSSGGPLMLPDVNTSYRSVDEWGHAASRRGLHSGWIPSLHLATLRTPSSRLQSRVIPPRACAQHRSIVCSIGTAPGLSEEGISAFPQQPAIPVSRP